MLVNPLHRYIIFCCDKNAIDCEVYYAPDSNYPGQDWYDRILDEIRKSNIVIIFWSKNSHSSMGQLIEIGAAWALRKKIFAVLYETSPSTLPPMVLKPSQSISYEKFLNYELFNLREFLLELI